MHGGLCLRHVALGPDKPAHAGDEYRTRVWEGPFLVIKARGSKYDRFAKYA